MTKAWRSSRVSLATVALDCGAVTDAGLTRPGALRRATASELRAAGYEVCDRYAAGVSTYVDGELCTKLRISVTHAGLVSQDCGGSEPAHRRQRRVQRA